MAVLMLRNCRRNGPVVFIDSNSHTTIVVCIGWLGAKPADVSHESDYNCTLSFVRILNFSMILFSRVNGCFDFCAIRFTAPM